MPENESPEHVIYSGQGQPFKSEPAARAHITKNGLDPNVFKVLSVEDGFIIRREEKVQKPEKYYRVRFSHKQNPYDEEDVILTVNGETLVMQRGVDTIIPGRFKECADHATYPHFTQNRPNEPRKQVGSIMVYPYSLLGEATEAEYLRMLREGNKTTKETLARQNKLID